ncbi:hypothetical protein OU994_17995 [Pseudoduganella sp. SL102]|uniref:hypothetical protein n=1 Tax=Pseudoduganella sp. SL102 TaxID=2995154 RepID=UPI00248B446E|nr:hypothetical protein [Pseudoduganella sp. SL102]WBS00213.1 hypothetical protein OU994_17995 [Pseudoduganella sp. SL102]
MFGTSHSLGGPPATETTSGLPVSVILLRRDGQRITGDEFRAAEPVVGRMLLGPAQRHRSGGGASHMAEVLRAGSVATGSACKPLFNPTIVLTDHRGFVLSGYEVALQDGRPVHVEQAWLVRPLIAAESVIS